jgi:serpin B
MLSFFFRFAPQAGSAQLQSLVAGNTAFALDLYAQLKTMPGNLFFSPFSISTALGMTYAGAKGDTRKQMAAVLHFDEGNQIHSGFGQLQQQLADAGKQTGIELSVANALWAQQGHPFLPEFVTIPRDEYQANLNQTDFASAAEAARTEVNRWVAQRTKDRIQDILPPGSLTSLTRLVLANAIYFKGAWARPFSKAATSEQPFHLSTTTKTIVPLMCDVDEVGYIENDDFQAVELPYSGRELSMVILLPRQVEGCASLEARLKPALISGALSRLKRQKVELYVPRFKLESSFDLNNTLARMGMTDAFSSKADFSGMDGTRLLYISGVFHKAWGEVNEEGTEAAAATVVAVAAKAMSRPPPPPLPVFRADHPFIFFIRDTRSGSVLFLGRLADPSR